MTAAVETLHERYVAPRRVRVLSAHVDGLIPPQSSVLDIGCGDGALAARLMQQRADLRVEGVDVLARPGSQIPVRVFDGLTVPYGEASVDVALLIDTLHHAQDPLRLLREAVRVARRSVIIKDHLCDGWLARPTLRFMDWVGNARHGVALPGTYWPKRRWLEAFQQVGLTADVWQDRLGLYPWPAHWIFERSLHFIARFAARAARAA